MDSKTETVSDNDEMIARFMGHQYDKKEFGVSRVLFKNLWLPPKYSTSWDWIMPVWIKFRDIGSPLNEEYDQWIASLQWYLFSSDEPKRFAERLAYAIKWYNSQSPGHN